MEEYFQTFSQVAMGSKMFGNTLSGVITGTYIQP